MKSELNESIRAYCLKNKYFYYCFDSWECVDTEDEFFIKLEVLVKKFQQKDIKDESN